MPKYLIEGSCDGGLFAETIEADNREEAERFAVERLCEAWGEEGEELSDLGDSASVREYDADDYARDAAPELLKASRGVIKWLAKALNDGAFDNCAMPRQAQRDFDALETAIKNATKQ